MTLNFQKQYDLIYAFFKTTTEPFSDLDWDGETLSVYFGDIKLQGFLIKSLPF